MKKFYFSIVLSSIAWILRYYRGVLLPEWTVAITFTMSYIALILLIESIPDLWEWFKKSRA